MSICVSSELTRPWTAVNPAPLRSRVFLCRFDSETLINAADLIGFVEQNYDELDWGRVRNQLPLQFKAIPLLHHLSPWNPETVDPGWIPRQRLEPRPYEGWPYKRLRDFKAEGRGFPEIVRRTFLPPKWWLGIYYGALIGLQRFFCLVWSHPRQVFWWARLYRSLPQESSSH